MLIEKGTSKQQVGQLTPCHHHDPPIALKMTMVNEFTGPQINKKKDCLTRAISLQEQYEKMLHDFGQIVDIAEIKLQTEVVLTDPALIWTESTRHKEFFASVHQCHASLDAMAEITDPHTRHRHVAWHKQLKTRATVLIDKATSYGQMLDTLAIRWSDLERRLNTAEAWLQKVAKVTEIKHPLASDEISNQLSSLTELSNEATFHRAHIEDLIHEGQSLIRSIHCPSLESALNDVKYRWQHLETVLMTRLETIEEVSVVCTELIEMLIRSEQLVDATNDRLATLRDRLKETSDGLDDDMRITVLQDVWDIQATATDQLSLENSLTLKLERIQRLQSIAEEPQLRERVSKLEKEWTEITSDLKSIGDMLDKAVLSRDSIQKAAAVVEEFVQEAQHALRNIAIDKIEDPKQCSAVRTTYKNLSNNMACKAKVLDVINLSVTQQIEDNPEDDGNSSSVEPYVEDIDEMNQKWHSVRSGIANNVSFLNALHQKESEFNDHVGSFSKLLTKVQNAVSVKRQCLRRDHAVIHRAAIEVKQLDKDLGQLQNKLNAVETFETGIPLNLKHPVLLNVVHEGAKSSRKQFDELTNAITDLKSALVVQIGLWDEWIQSKQLVQQSIVETRYTLELFSVSTTEVMALESQCHKFRELQSVFVSHTSHLELFRLKTEQIVSSCDAEVADELISVLSKLETQWKTLRETLQSQSTARDEVLQLWLLYSKKYDSLIVWINREETEFQKLLFTQIQSLTGGDTSGGADHIDQCEALKNRVAEMRNQLKDIRLLSVKLEMSEEMSASVRTHISGEVDYAEQKIAALENDIQKDGMILMGQTAEAQECQSSLESLNEFLTLVQADVANSPVDLPDCAALENAVSIFKSHLNEFSKREIMAASFTSPQFQATANRKLSSMISNVLQQWNILYIKVLRKYQRLELQLLVKLEFDSKVQRLRATLDDVNNLLRSPGSTNFHGLLLQNKALELQHSRLVDQNRVIREEDLILGSVLDEERDDKRQVVDALEVDWSSALEATTAKRSDVEIVLQLWRNYKQLTQRFSLWLVDKERERLELQIKHAPIKKVETVLQKIETVLISMERGTAMLQELETVGQNLCSHLDESTMLVVVGEVSRFQQHIGNMEAGLSTWQKFLKRTWQKWNYCDATISDIQGKLKELSNVFTHSLPTRYDDISRAYDNCKDYQKSLDEMCSLMNALLDEEEELREIVSPEDVRILHQRVLLVKQMWVEINHLLVLHHQLLEDQLQKWNKFDALCESFTCWVQEMETKLSEDDGSIELLARKLEEVYAAKIRLMIDDKNRLNHVGRELMANSNEEKAKSIGEKIKRANEGWQKVDDACSRKLKKIRDITKDIAELDTRMKELCNWLSLVERHLSTPIQFQFCSKEEIQRLLNEQDSVQYDIDQHKKDVDSVLSLCSVLHRDCRNRRLNGEASAIDQASQNLAQKWHKINQSSADRRTLIHATWSIWDRLSADRHTFERWMTAAEQRTHTLRAENIKSYIALEDGVTAFNQLLEQIHERRKAIKDINRQYHQLAQENLLDKAITLKQNIHSLNGRYDVLFHLVLETSPLYKRIFQEWTEFLAEKKEFLLWLTEINNQLSFVETSSDEPRSRLSLLENIHKRVVLDDNRWTESIEHGMSIRDAALNNDMQSAVETDLQEVNGFRSNLMSWFEAQRAAIEELREVQTLAQSDLGVQVDTLDLLQTSDVPSSATDEKDSLETAEQDASSLEFDEPLDDTLSQEATPLADIQLYMRDLEIALRECRDGLQLLEESIQSSVLYGNSLDDIAEHHEKCFATSHSCIDLVLHISDLLCDETELPRGPPYSGEVGDVVTRWSELEILARDKEHKLREAVTTWQQFHKDITAIENWLPVAESHQHDHSVIPKSIEELDVAIKVHRQFLLELDSRKAVMMSLNLCSQNLLKQMASKAEAKKLRERIKILNRRWEKLCKYATERQTKLQAALLHCREFHSTIDELLAWLRAADRGVRQVEPINIGASLSDIQAKRDKFMELKTELDRCEPRIVSLHEMAHQLLLNVSSAQGRDVRAKISTLVDRIETLQTLCNAYIANLDQILQSEDLEVSQRMNLIRSGCEETCISGSLLTLSTQYLDSGTPIESTTGDNAMHHRDIHGDVDSTHGDDDDDDRDSPRRTPTSTLSRCGLYLSRVLRASLPIQALMLLLLGIASLVPLYEEDYQCALSNNFARSLDPMLQYRSGPPPT